jgi:hypothetical protein
MMRMDIAGTWASGSVRGCWDPSVKACVILLLLPLSTLHQASASDVVSTSPRGDLVATAVDGGRIEIRPIFGGNGIVTIQHKGVPVLEDRRLNAVSWIPSFVFSPDGTVLASGCAWLPVTLWDVKTGRRLREFANARVGYDLHFSADGSRLIGSGLVNKTGLQRLSLWDAETGKTLRELTVDTPLEDVNWDRKSIRPRFAKSGPMLVIEVINGTERSLRVWNTASNKQTLVVKSDRLFPADWVISTDGKYLIVREYSRDVIGAKRHRVFEMESGDNIKNWTPVSP